MANSGYITRRLANSKNEIKDGLSSNRWGDTQPGKLLITKLPLECRVFKHRRQTGNNRFGVPLSHLLVTIDIKAEILSECRAIHSANQIVHVKDIFISARKRSQSQEALHLLGENLLLRVRKELDALCVSYNVKLKITLNDFNLRVNAKIDLCDDLVS